jgi:predicted cupin superfamily sugar epimerase
VNAESLIRALGLQPHPEGGFYRETYRSSLLLPGSSLGGSDPLSASTAIYFMLVPGNVSHFHRLVYDEMFHFHMGDPVRWVLLHPDGRLEERFLGLPGPKGQEPQLVIPAGCWFGGALVEGGAYALMGTTMAPGFEFKDFELAKRADLLMLFPHAEIEILRLT